MVVAARTDAEKPTAAAAAPETGERPPRTGGETETTAGTGDTAGTAAPATPAARAPDAKPGRGVLRRATGSSRRPLRKEAKAGSSAEKPDTFDAGRVFSSGGGG